MGDKLYVTDPLCRRALLVDSDGKKENVTMAPAIEGQPIPTGAELVYIDNSKPNDDGSYRVVSRWRNGPSQVATKAYRDNYETVFTKKDTSQN